ncbi:MAG: SIR2 family NAD-dependent protein deacylase [Vulcanimicrobiaceae bacterium]
MREIQAHDRAMRDIAAALDSGSAVPYLGSRLLTLAGEGCPLPASPETLVDRLTAKASVPHKIRKNLTAAAQFIENFKHRSTVKAAMTEAFAPSVEPTELHRMLAAQPALPLLVHAWYDDLPQKALAVRKSWGIVQGISQAEHFGTWVHYFNADGTRAEASSWETLLYQPLGSTSPAGNFLLSDSDYVEVLTEIDIQTPIPQEVQELRADRHFLFLGCRFATQLDRVFARQIMKRSSAKHWAVLPEEPTRNEARFLAEQNIERLDLPLADFVEALKRSQKELAERPVAVGF